MKNNAVDIQISLFLMKYWWFFHCSKSMMVLLDQRIVFRHGRLNVLAWDVKNSRDEDLIKIELFWLNLDENLQKYCKKKLFLLIAKNMILRFCSSIQTTIKTMFFDISKIKLFLHYRLKTNAVENQISPLFINFSCLFQMLITFSNFSRFGWLPRDRLAQNKYEIFPGTRIRHTN